MDHHRNLVVLVVYLGYDPAGLCHDPNHHHLGHFCYDHPGDGSCCDDVDFDPCYLVADFDRLLASFRPVIDF